MIYFTLIFFGLYGGIGFFASSWRVRWFMVVVITVANLFLWQHLEADIITAEDTTGAMHTGYWLILGVMEAITLGTFAAGCAFGSVVRERKAKHLQLGVTDEE